MKLLVYALLPLLLTPLTAKEKLTEGERIELIRGLSAEYATVREFLPKSKKPLDFDADGTWDKSHWASLGQELGPVARVGELVQITRVILLNDRVVLEINGGQKNGRHWYDHVEVGMGNRTTPINNNTQANAGTSVAILFHKPLESIDSASIKALLRPVLDFDKHTATKLYADTPPPEVKKAITEKRAEQGMDRQQVLLALGRPDRKVRETKDGDELEDWIYGTPPGRILFVTFTGDKVLKVKETYAGLGAEAAKPLEVPR